MSELYASITDSDNIFTVNVNESHSSSTAIASFSCKDTSLGVGDHIDINLGYVGDYGKVFSGYVKIIERKIPDNIYTVTAYDDMIRAIDYFVASSSPDSPFTRQNIQAEDLISAILSLAGLTSFDFDNSMFTLAITVPAEVNLVSAYDYCKSVADYVAWNLWCDRNGTIHFANRKPYPMDGTSSQPGDNGDTSVGTLLTTDCLDLNHSKSEKNLRNRIVVYGSSGVTAEASQATSYDFLTDSFVQVLPSGFYKAVVFSTDLITSTNYAQDACDYNLALFNRLTHEVNLTIPGVWQRTARTVLTLDDSYLGLDGDWYIYQLEHNWGKQGFTTNMSLRV